MAIKKTSSSRRSKPAMPRAPKNGAPVGHHGLVLIVLGRAPTPGGKAKPVKK